MSLFHNILQQLSEKLQGSELFKENIAKDISEIIGITINTDQFKIKDGKILFLVSPTIKTVVNLKKSIILNKLYKYKITTIG